MITEIKIPDVGIEEFEVTEILVKVGDKVKVEESLITIEGNKASVEIPSPVAGIVKEIKINIGDKIETGKLIMLFDSNGESANIMPIEKKEIKTVFTDISAIDNSLGKINIPELNGDIFEVNELLVKIGDKIAIERPLIIIENNKLLIRVLASFVGIVKIIKVNIGDKVFSNSLIMIAKIEDTTSTLTLTEQKTINSSNLISKLKELSAISSVKNENKLTFMENDNYVHATPFIRRLAAEFGINLSKIKGTGRKGRILYEDILLYMKSVFKTMELNKFDINNSHQLNLLPWPKIDFSKFGEIEEIKLISNQKISGANLSRNWVTIPHVTHFDKIDITELEEFRKQQNNEAEKLESDIKSTMLSFVMKAIANALERMLRFNSSLSEDGQSLIIKKYINIGIAVDTIHGLLVPVLKDVNKKGIKELSKELTVIIKKARNGKLTIDEMQGGCFTISNIGSLGTTYFTPIINAPEVAIVGISKYLIEPVWNGKKFIPRLMLPISLSFDHRVIDGADAARFITIINNNLSDIRRLIM